MQRNRRPVNQNVPIICTMQVMAVETPFWRSDLMADQSVLRTTGVSPLGSSSKRATIAPMHEMTGFGGFLTSRVAFLCLRIAYLLLTIALQFS